MDKPKISRHTKEIEQFCKKYHIASLALFGSILTASFNSSSDVDFLVQFQKEYTPTLFDLVDMESELESIIGHKVDLKTPNDLSPYFREKVIAQSKIIYD